MDWNFLTPSLDKGERILLKRYATLGDSTWGTMYVTTANIRFVSKSLTLRRQSQQSRCWSLDDVASVSRVEQENGRTLFTWNGLQRRIRIIFSTHEAIYFNEDSRYVDDTLHKIKALTTDQTNDHEGDNQ
jgi:hypothetical protein